MKPEDLSASQRKLLVALSYKSKFVIGAALRFARSLERLGLAMVTAKKTHEGECWYAENTDAGHALAQRLIDIAADEEQDMWIERDDLRERRDALREELAKVEKRLAVLEAMPS